MWIWKRPIDYNNGLWECFNLNHYAELQPIDSSEASMSHIYSGGPSLDQLNGCPPSLLPTNVPENYTNIRIEQSLSPANTNEIEELDSTRPIISYNNTQLLDKEIQDNISRINNLKRQTSTVQPDISNSKKTKMMHEEIQDNLNRIQNINKHRIVVETVDDDSDDDNSIIADSATLPGYISASSFSENIQTAAFSEQENETDDEQQNECNDTSLYCCNCCRHYPDNNRQTEPYKLHLEETDTTVWRSSKNKKFCFISEWKKKNVYICEECKKYMNWSSKLKCPAQYIWPAFVWSLLRNPRLYIRVWFLVVFVWRPWWIQSVFKQHSIPISDLLKTKTVFQDTSSDTMKDLKCLTHYAGQKLPKESYP